MVEGSLGVEGVQGDYSEANMNSLRIVCLALQFTFFIPEVLVT